MEQANKQTIQFIGFICDTWTAYIKNNERKRQNPIMYGNYHISTIDTINKLNNVIKTCESFIERKDYSKKDKKEELLQFIENDMSKINEQDLKHITNDIIKSVVSDNGTNDIKVIDPEKISNEVKEIQKYTLIKLIEILHIKDINDIKDIVENCISNCKYYLLEHLKTKLPIGEMTKLQCHNQTFINAVGWNRYTFDKEGVNALSYLFKNIYMNHYELNYIVCEVLKVAIQHCNDLIVEYLDNEYPDVSFSDAYRECDTSNGRVKYLTILEKHENTRLERLKLCK